MVQAILIYIMFQRLLEMIMTICLQLCLKFDIFRNSSYCSSSFFCRLRQVQVRGFVEPNNEEIHFQDRRNYGRIFPTWYNGHNHEHRAYNKGFQDSRSWLPRRVIVDDKIEAPLSKTKQSEE